MRLDTVIPSSSGLSCMEDHEAQQRPWYLPMVVAKLFLQQLLQDTISSHEAHLAWHDETPHQCWQCCGEGWMHGMPALGTSSKSQALLLSQGKCHFDSAWHPILSIAASQDLPSWSIKAEHIFQQTGQLHQLQKCRCFQAARTLCKEWSFSMHNLQPAGCNERLLSLGSERHGEIQQETWMDDFRWRFTRQQGSRKEKEWQLRKL